MQEFCRDYHWMTGIYEFLQAWGCQKLESMRGYPIKNYVMLVTRLNAWQAQVSRIPMELITRGRLLLLSCRNIQAEMGECRLVSVVGFLKFYVFIYLWLHWAFVAARRSLSLLAANGGCSRVTVALLSRGFSLQWFLLWSTGSSHACFSSCSVRVCSGAKSCLTLCDPYELYSASLLCPQGFPGRHTGVGCHFLLQGIFLSQGSNLHLLSPGLSGGFFNY